MFKTLSLALITSLVLIGCQALPEADKSTQSAAPVGNEGFSIAVWGDFIESGGLLEDPTVGASWAGYPYSITDMTGTTDARGRKAMATLTNLSGSPLVIEYKVAWYDVSESPLPSRSDKWVTLTLGNSKIISGKAPSPVAKSCNIFVRVKE